MRGIDTLIQTLEKEKEQASCCKCLDVAKTDNNYYSYLEGKEEAFDLAIRLLRELKHFNED